jgi:F-box/WD-40 domain protein MET30
MLHGPPATANQQHLRPLGLGTATPVVISGSLDNQIKFWDVEKGVCTKTLFGHVQGIWDIACNQLRIVSASHDRTLKVSFWSCFLACAHSLWFKRYGILLVDAACTR